MLRNFSSGATEVLFTTPTHPHPPESLWRNHLSLCNLLSSSSFHIKQHFGCIYITWKSQEGKDPLQFPAIQYNVFVKIFVRGYSRRTLESGNLLIWMFFLHIFLKFLVSAGFQTTFSSHISRAKPMEAPMTFVSEPKRPKSWRDPKPVTFLQTAETCAAKGRKKRLLLQSRYQLPQLK